MKMLKATERYEAWLSRRLTIVEADLKLKHEQMRADVFPFLRATYYRWAQVWQEVCGKAARAPQVLAVGDLHVENFGTWRDVDGRLIWGVNDFDEAYRMPFTNDLIRLATSVLLGKMACDLEAGIAEILKGYRDGLTAGGRPYVLAEHHPSIRHMATARLHEPERFWQKLHALPEVAQEPPTGAIKAIERLMPERNLRWHVTHRVAGLGSLGRERYVALVQWKGGSIAREAKALAPSACVWAANGKGSASICYQEIIDNAVRCKDPFVKLEKRWIVRRLAPDCSRIELAALPEQRDELHLLHGMGFETANIHLGSIKPRTLQNDLDARPRGWLFDAAEKMQKAVVADFNDYRKS